MSFEQLSGFEGIEIVHQVSESDLRSIANQIQKDFELSGASFAFEATRIHTLDDLVVNLVCILTKIIQVAPRELMNLLYRVDIPEHRVSNALLQHQNLDSSFVIAALLIVKAHKKIELRKRFK